MGELQKRIKEITPTEHGIYTLQQFKETIGYILWIVDEMCKEFNLADAKCWKDDNQPIYEWEEKWLE